VPPASSYVHPTADSWITGRSGKNAQPHSTNVQHPPGAGKAAEVRPA
jgi:hypothetical protein